MKKAVAVAFLAFVIGGATTFGAVYYLQNQEQQEGSAKTLVMQEELATLRKGLLGYTKFMDYMTVTKKAMSGQMHFLAAKVDREYVKIEHIQKAALGLKADATIVVKYSVEYSVGYDLRPESFTVTGDKNGITITLSRPELIASPAVNILSHQIPNSSLFIDAKTAVITLQQRLLPIAIKQAIDIKGEEAVRALCEKNLAEFLRDFLAKQPGVNSIPTIRIAYKT